MNKIIQQIINATTLSEQQAWWLLEFICNKNHSQLLYLSTELSTIEQRKLQEHIEQISIHHKPLSYILGWVPFLDLELQVQAPTLIPRPETEAWVYELIQSLKKSIENTNALGQGLMFLDIGTGSGCIALSLAKAFPLAQIYAIDIAESALELAQKNAQKNDIKNITFLKSDLFNNLSKNLKFDLIVSNPPYIDPKVQLEQTVAAWEDHGALFAKNQGLKIIKQIIQQAPAYLTKNSLFSYNLVIEIDVSQGLLVKNILTVNQFSNIIIQKDQYQRDRTAWAKYI